MWRDRTDASVHAGKALAKIYVGLQLAAKLRRVPVVIAQGSTSFRGSKANGRM